jgi:adenine phosphoribosyltransferase
MDIVQRIASLLKPFPDFPKPGILFQDIFPIFKDPQAVEALVDHLAQSVRERVTDKVHAVVGLDARGFLLGPLLAIKLNAAFIPVRKHGKLPGPCLSATYTKEYGDDVFDMQQDAIEPGQNVMVVDDLIATGGSAKAAQELIQAAGGNLVLFLFIVELTALNGTAKLNAPSYSMVQFDD